MEMISSDTLPSADLDGLDFLPFTCVDTLTKAFQRSVERIPNGNWLGSRNGEKYDWITFEDVSTKSHSLAVGIERMGLAPTTFAEGKDWKMIGILAKNQPNWVISLLANMENSITTIPLYDTLGPQAMSFILNETEISTIITSQDHI